MKAVAVLQGSPAGFPAVFAVMITPTGEMAPAPARAHASPPPPGGQKCLLVPNASFPTGIFLFCDKPKLASATNPTHVGIKLRKW